VDYERSQSWDEHFASSGHQQVYGTRDVARPILEGHDSTDGLNSTERTGDLPDLGNRCVKGERDEDQAGYPRARRGSCGGSASRSEGATALFELQSPER